MPNRINFIVNSLDPYQYEIHNILALPIGSVFRFRYQDKWINKDCFSKSLLIEGLEGYVFFNHSSKFYDEKDQAAAPFSNYYPLRKLKYIKHEEVGSICYFECELLEYFSYPSGSFLSSKESKKLDSLFEGDNFLVYIDTANKELENVEPKQVNSNIDNRNWVRTVEAVSNIDVFKSYDFYRISSILCTSSPDSAPVFIKNGFFDLIAQESYEIIITQWRRQVDAGREGNTNKKRGIEVIETPHIITSQNFAMALGKYDILKLAIVLPSVSYETKSYLQLDYTVDSTLVRTVDNSIRLPVLIKKKAVKLRLRLMLLVLIVLVYLFPNFLPLVLDGNERLLRDLSLIAATITLVDLLRDYKE